MQEFPLMLYRPGSEVETMGRAFDTLIVADADEEAAAGKDGWQRHDTINPLDRDGDGNSGGSLPKRGRPRKNAE